MEILNGGDDIWQIVDAAEIAVQVVAKRVALVVPAVAVAEPLIQSVALVLVLVSVNADALVVADLPALEDHRAAQHVMVVHRIVLVQVKLQHVIHVLINVVTDAAEIANILAQNHAMTIVEPGA